MPFCPGNTFVRYSFPNEFSTGFVESIELPGVFRHVSMRLNISEESMPKRFILGLAADGRDDKHPVTPNDWARQRQARDRNLPAQVDVLFDIPLCWHCVPVCNT
jgi:hypothetical protein